MRLFAKDDSVTDTIDWRGLDRDALGLAYNNAAAVPGSADTMTGFEARSAEMRRAHPDHLDIPYGTRPRNRFDFIPAGAGAPTLVFIHGGYWQMRSKETFTFAAAGPLAAGIATALVGYTLAPEATLDEMVAEIRSALDVLVSRLPQLGGDPGKIWIAGWSAGGHLAAMTLDHPAVRGGLGISGLYELEPIRRTYINDKLALDEEAARRNSPLLHLPAKSPPFEIAVGGAELPLMRRQSADFARARTERGLPGSLHELPGDDHFTIVEQLASPDGRLTEIVAAMCGD